MEFGIRHNAAVTKAGREFIVDVAFVVLGTANAIRGLAVGDTALVIGGLFLLALIVTELAIGPKMHRLYLRIFRRPPGARIRRVIVAFFGLAILADAIQLIPSAVNRDWWAFLFHALRLAAGSVILVDFRAWSRTKPERLARA